MRGTHGAPQTRQLKAIVPGNLHENSKARRLVFVDKCTQVTLSVSYLGFNVAPTLAALSLAQGLGPVASNEWLVIIVRNIGVVLWQLSSLAGSYLLLTEARTLYAHTAASGADKTSEASSEHVHRSAAVQRVVERIEGDTRHIMVTVHFRGRELTRIRKLLNVLVLIIYAIFSVPVTWPFQTFR
jgi:hypothetical protein